MNLTLTLFSHPAHLLSSVWQLLTPISNYLYLVTLLLSSIIFIVFILVVYSDSPSYDGIIVDYPLFTMVNRWLSNNVGHTILNLVCQQVPGTTHFVVFDKNDPTSANMLALFNGKNYETQYYQGKTVLYVRAAANKFFNLDTGRREVKLLSLSPVLSELESRNFLINSNGQPIEKANINPLGNTILFIRRGN